MDKPEVKILKSNIKMEIKNSFSSPFLPLSILVISTLGVITGVKKLHEMIYETECHKIQRGYENLRDNVRREVLIILSDRSINLLEASSAKDKRLIEKGVKAKLDALFRLEAGFIAQLDQGHLEFCEPTKEPKPDYNMLDREIRFAEVDGL